MIKGLLACWVFVFERYGVGHEDPLAIQYIRYRKRPNSMPASTHLHAYFEMHYRISRIDIMLQQNRRLGIAWEYYDSESCMSSCLLSEAAKSAAIILSTATRPISVDTSRTRSSRRYVVRQVHVGTHVATLQHNTSIPQPATYLAFPFCGRPNSSISASCCDKVCPDQDSVGSRAGKRE